MDSELSADERNFILKSLIGNSGCPRRVAGICIEHFTNNTYI